ncbi:MAG: diguanylate cyclase [Oscillospiraceae bacterium]|jgi:AraC family transcriptional regulator|nr:diguanylate cyclase [Oscillospiraceae bacterium]
MRNIYALLSVIEYIEQNLTEPLELEEIAKAAYMSLSNLHRVFSKVFRSSLRNYVTKRRICRAAYDLINSDERITDIALNYQYENTESFTRAFRKQFLVTPSEFRGNKRTFYNLYPKLLLSDYTKGDFEMQPRKYDISELSAQILSAKGTYILYIDIDHLKLINDTMGHDAGDAALAETTARIERSISPGMTFFRTGNDDFTVLTGSDDLAVAEEVAAKLISFADNDVTYNGGSLKFSVSVGIAAIPKEISDAKDAIAKADSAMMEAKLQGRNRYRVL